MNKKQLRKALQQMVMSYEGKYGKNKSLDGYIKVEKDNIVFYYFIDNKKKEITIVIRGSDDFEDWKYNLKYSKIKTNYGKIHKGFWELSDNLYELFLDKFVCIDKNIKYAEYIIVIIGHSLGGALSQILALDIIHWTRAVMLITAGSPRWCNRKAAKYFNTDRI